MSDDDLDGNSDDSTRKIRLVVDILGIVGVIILAPIITKQRSSSTTTTTTTTTRPPLRNHGIFVVVAIVSILLLPDFMTTEFFSTGGVLVIGTIVPVYSSIVAVCTPGEHDDTAMLVYWIVSGAFNYLTEFVDEIKGIFPSGGEHWYEFEFFVTLWMLLPQTDGAALIYDKVLEPYIAPIAQRFKSKLEGWMAIILAVVNTGYLTVAWWVFMFFPHPARRFIVVLMGTIYPMTASTVAVTTTTHNNNNATTKQQQDQNDDTSTFWLTYWSCFSLLFVAMDYLENFVGTIPGFYSLCMAATLYLFLPMFDGANVVFRRILVPLSGQYENMLLHDAYLVRKGMESSIPQQYHERIFQKAANVFSTPATNKKVTNAANKDE